MPVIDVTVAPNGETRIETQGFVGAQCQQATRALEAALGLVQSEQLTPDFYQPTTQETSLAARPNAE
jgi:hypothetical protein